MILTVRIIFKEEKGKPEMDERISLVEVDLEKDL